MNISQQQIESLPNYTQQTFSEWSSECPNPQCYVAHPSHNRYKSDRFRYWPDDGNYWCRQCGLNGFVDGQGTIDPQVIEQKRRDREARERKIRTKKITNMARLRKTRPDLVYHRQLSNSPTWLEYVQETWGISRDTIARNKIGLCNTHELSMILTKHQTASISIPFYYQDMLVTLRHRLVIPNGQGKYMPECAGLPSAIYNADVLLDPGTTKVVLVEGEMKVMVLEEHLPWNGYRTTGVSGMNIFLRYGEKWAKLYRGVEEVYVCLDPGAFHVAEKVARIIKETNPKQLVRVVPMPVKPDDFFVRYDGGTAQFETFLKQGVVV